MPEEIRPQTVHELVRHLADTLVESEVMQPMEKIGWSHGTPPPPGMPDNPASGGAPPTETRPNAAVPAGTTPAPVQPGAGAPKTDAPVDLNAHFESLREPNGLILGKYPTVQDAIKGVGHAVNMAKQAFTQRDQLQKELDRLSGEVTQLRQTPPAAPSAAAPSQSRQNLVPSRERMDKAQVAYDAVLSQVVAEGGLLDEESKTKLSNAQRELNMATAKYAAEETQLERDAATSEENAKWSKVDEFMNERYPDAKNFADEIGLYVQTDPLIQKAVQALAKGGQETDAAELAWLSFDRSRGGQAAVAERTNAEAKEIELQAADQVRREAVDQARKNAGIIATSGGGVHEAPGTAPSQDEIEAAASAMRAMGATPGNPAAARWRELTIGRTLPSEIFGS